MSANIPAASSLQQIFQEETTTKMPSITEEQRAYYKIAQLSYSLDKVSHDGAVHDSFLGVYDVNLKVLGKKSGKDVFMGSTPLHIAGYHHQIEIFDNMLRHGADFTTKNNNGDSALHLAFRNIFRRYHRKQVVEDRGLDNEFVNAVLTAHVKFGITENPCSQHGLSHFHIACAANHCKAVHHFLDSGIAIDESVSEKSSIFPGYTPLHFAVRFYGYESAKLLWQRGADVNAKDFKGLTPMHIVVERNLKLIQLKSITGDEDLENLNKNIKENEKIIEFFLENTKEMHLDITRICKLHIACTLSDSLFAERFLKDFDVNYAISMDSSAWPGYTPLHFAVRSNINTVKLLLQNGANIAAEDAQIVTPFDLCTEKLSPEDLHSILSMVPAFKDILFSDNETRLTDFVDVARSLTTLEKFFETKPKDLFLPKNCVLWPGYWLAHLLVQFSKVFAFEKAAIYLNFDDSAMKQDSRGRTPLHLAFYQKKTKLINSLFKHQLGIAEFIDDVGLSHLHIACEQGSEAVVKALIYNGVDVNVTYKGRKLSETLNRGSTPLHISVLKRNVENVKILLECGANANSIDADGITPIHHILTSLSPKVNKEIGDILFSSCDLTKAVSSKNGLTYLHVASSIGNESAVKCLLEFGADPNAVFLCKDEDEKLSMYTGYTPLHFVVDYKDTKLIQLLLRNGADVLSKRSDRMTMLYDMLIGTRGAFKKYVIHVTTMKFFTSILASDTKLRKRAEEDSRLTLLHIACFLGDVKQIIKLLTDSRVDVNAQMHEDSPIWPKATPLHLLTETTYGFKNLVLAMKLLLDHGADVTLIDGMGETPVHKAWANHRWDRDDYHLLLLMHQKDFSNNPVNEKGISHFHLACLMNEYIIVEKFLKNGVDVNLPVDYAYERLTFQTPLHFMLNNALDNEDRLKTIDVLLEYGADVNVPDEKGTTPFLRIASCGSSRNSRRDLYFETLYKAGADINYTNMKGQTALEILICIGDNPNISKEEAQFFFDNYNFNIFNSVYETGVISMLTINRYRSTELNLEIIMEKPELFTVDRMGRTPIHNIVSNDITSTSAIEYANYIERFVKMNYNIDAQDLEGKTALHSAAYFSNEQALLGLLIAGADINITDHTGRTVLVTLLESHPRWSWNHIFSGQEENTRMMNKIGLHKIVMHMCDLEMHLHDFQLIDYNLSEERFDPYREAVLKELEMTKLVRIGTGTLTLRDFLSETGAVASRPSMTSQADREAIGEFFESVDVNRFPHLKTVLKLQYRKALQRLSLIEEATHSMKRILGGVNGFSMPEICCRLIIRFLTNTDIKRLIMSTDNTA